MTSLPFNPAAKAVEAFADAGGRIVRAEHGHGGRPKRNWATSLLKGLLHAALAAAAVSWTARGYLDRIEARQEQMEHQVDELNHQVEHLSERVDDVLLKQER